MTIPRTLFRLFSILLDYRRRSEIVNALPIKLWVESSSRCNLRCVMCPNKNMPAGEKAFMDMALFRKIVDEARYFANDMYLHHRGEPLLNPNLFDMIALAREAGLKTRFHSNGTLLTAEKTDALLNARPDMVSFSVDGFEKAPYEKVRVGATFETTVENIVRLAETRRARRLGRPYIVVEKIAFSNPDYRADPAAADALRKRFLAAGVDEVIEKAEYIWAEETAPECPADQRSYNVCTFPWYAMVICADGTVTPCPQDFWAKMNMGNISRKTLIEIWNDTPYRELRRAFVRNINSLPLCRKCDRLHRKTVGGVPFQYAITFLVDQLVGYGTLRRLCGTSERN